MPSSGLPLQEVAPPTDSLRGYAGVSICHRLRACVTRPRQSLSGLLCRRWHGLQIARVAMLGCHVVVLLTIYARTRLRVDCLCRVWRVLQIAPVAMLECQFGFG